jgi:hypothetical protein
MTDRDALKQEMFARLRSLVLGEDFSDSELHHMVSLNEDDNLAGRKIAEELAQIALRHITAERKHLTNVAYSWWGMGLEEMVGAMRRLPIGADVEEAP